MTTDFPGKPPIDHAFRSETLKGGAADPTYAGALSFMRRRYSRDLTGVDLADPRHPPRRDGDEPAGRPLRAAGDPPRLGDLRRRPAISLRDRHFRRARRRRLRRRGARPAQPADHPRDDRGGGEGDPRFRRPPLLARRRPFLHLAAAQGACGQIRAARFGPVRRAPGHLGRRRQETLARHLRDARRARGHRQSRPLHPDRRAHPRAGGMRHRGALRL